MIYEIQIGGSEQDDGKIDLLRLAQLAQYIIDIAKGALQIRLQGYSAERGRPSERVNNAIKIKLSDLKEGHLANNWQPVSKYAKQSSTILVLECSKLAESLQGQQGDVFKPEMLSELFNQTPVGLVMESFRQALNYKEEASQLDKALLKKLKYFERLFVSEDEFVTLSNRGSIQEVKLTKKDFKKIQVLEESIPESQTIIINGIVNELNYFKSRVSIVTDDGPVNGILGEELDSDISKYWGKQLTIHGTAHYMPGGKMSFLYVEKIFEPSSADKYFSKQPKKETVEQQIQRQQKSMKGRNQLRELIGQWPGDESIEELINALD